MASCPPSLASAAPGAIRNYLFIYYYAIRQQSKINQSIKTQQELSYRKQIARQLRTQFIEGISVTLKSTLRVTQGH